MKLLSSRLLRGPNVHSPQPCLVAHLDLEELAGAGPARIAQIVGRLAARLAAVGDTAASANDPADLLDAENVGNAADVVMRLVRALQRRAGTPVDIGRVVGVHGAPGQRRLVCGYEHEAVVEQALTVALGAVAAAAIGREVDFSGAVTALRLLAVERAIDPGTSLLLNHARRRGIPVLRPDERAHRFQLGWGSRQRCVEAVADSAPATATAMSEDDAVRRLDSLFPGGGNGRIPLIAVTGTNGKTTTTLLIAHGIKLCGARVGTTTTQGIFIDGRAVERGDCTGYWSARTVLASVDVDAAVLESARGGIVKRGLGFDRCNVGVVLNVSADHLGLDGIETLADLADAKGVIARCATTAAVLNAEDPYCAAMAGRLRPGCEPVDFSMDPGNTLFNGHLADGGCGACLDGEGWLVWCEGSRSHRVLEAARMPVSLQGRARYNIANGLAALAALACSGLDLGDVSTALASFVSDARSNPLRGNLFRVAGVTLVVDYAHNAAAYRALCETARSLLPGPGARLLGVITSPGDRRSTDLSDVGAVCGTCFDELVVYEQDPRGRGCGETTAAILAGARSTAGGKPLHGEPKIRTALARGLALARPQDVLVFTCAGTLADLVEGVRSVYPAEAERISREVAA